MEPGQCSGTKEEVDHVWATLVPSDSNHAEIELRTNETGIYSKISCSSLEKQRWCTITRNVDQNSAVATIRNTSLSAIQVDGAIVEKGGAMGIECGTKIIPVPDMKGHLQYTFNLKDEKHEKQRFKISLDVDHSKCSICLNIWHDVVTLTPCLHNFCNGCFSEWMKRSQSVICPQCRATAISVGRNHFLHNIEEAILQNLPSFKRPDEELAMLDKSALVHSNLVLNTRKYKSRKRPSPSTRDDDDDGMDLHCPQCVSQLGGFRCSQSTIHLQCHACGGIMPYRPDLGIPQNCTGCDRAFCGAYWQAQGLCFGDLNVTCGRDTFKPISEHSILRIPDSAHQKNLYEQNITENCIQSTGKSLQAIISEWILKFSNRELDRSRLSLKQANMLSVQSHLCIECYHELVGYLLYWFRVSMPRYLLPPDASNREDCWYGYACRTQHHNPEHAQKRNHVCRPTRGNLGSR